MAKKEEKTNEIALFGKQNGGAVANFQQDAGMGNENVGSEDMSIPRIVLLQALSKVVSDGLEGAKAGVFHNTITDEMYEKLYVIPVSYDKEYSVFKKRDLGGGFNGAFPTHQEAADHVETLQGGKNSYDVIESARHVLLVLDENGKPTTPVVMHFSGTALTTSNTWNSNIQMTQPDNAPRFAGVWLLDKEKRSNSKGTWFIPSFSFCGLCDQPLYDEAKKLYLSLSKDQQAA